MKSVNKFCFLSGLLVALLGFLPALAQVDYATATLKGTVSDPQGAVIVGATVTATNSTTGIAKSANSASDGRYQIPALTPGLYQISVEAKGFAKEVAKGVELTVGQGQVFDVHLKVGTPTEVVEVGADTVPLIQTEQTQQANTINQLQVTDLPNLTHSITAAVYTVPGVTNADAPRAQTPGFTGFGTTGFSIGGSNGRNNLSTIDGGENEYGTGQYRITTIPYDAIQEFQINRNGYAAEFGFTDGSAINIVTKSGGNQLHGSISGEFSDQNTQAANFFNNIQGLPQAFSQDVYLNGSLGGAIKKDKLFFFVAYEYRHLDAPEFTNAGILSAPTVTGPSAAQTTYVNALLNNPAHDPFLIGFAHGITPGLTPLNNPALNTILHRDAHIFDDRTRDQNPLVRFDMTPNANNSIGLKFEYSHNNFTTGSPDSNGGPFNLFTRDFSILGTWSHTFSSSLLNQVLMQIVPRNSANADPNAFTGVNFSLGNLGVSGLGGTSSFGSPSLIPYDAHQRRYQFEDNLSWTHGAHSFKFGASMRLADYTVTDRLWFNNQFDFKDGAIPLFALAPATPVGPCPPLPPSVQLSPVQCHLALFNLSQGLPIGGPPNTNLSAPQSFVFGIPVDVLASFNNPTWTGWGKYFGSYIQDSWKVTPRFTLNAGVRMDFDGEPSPLGNNFYASPRLGFSWDPFGDHKTVIRAGGGVYYAPVDVLIPSYAALLDGSGRYINETIAALPNDKREIALWNIGVADGHLPFGSPSAADYAAAGIVNAPGATVAYGVNSNYKNPYSIETSASVQRELVNNLSVELGYLMYHGVHLQMPLETGYNQINPGNPACSAAAFQPDGASSCTDITGGPLYIPNSTQLQHTTYESIGNSTYHGFTASLTKRYSNHLQFQANYTWSKTLDDVIDFASFQNWFRPNQLGLYKAPSVFDIPHIFVANAVYTTPFKTGGNVLNTIFADISLAPVVTVRSGIPFSIRTPSLVNGIPLDSNFATPFHAGRDADRGANFATTDLRFTKSIFVNRDRGVRMDLIAQGTNIFNRVNFNKVSDVFDTGGIPLVPHGTNNCPLLFCAGSVALANGQSLDLFNGPFTGLHGVAPKTLTDLQKPLSYSSADAARRVQFGLKVAF